MGNQCCTKDTIDQGDNINTLNAHTADINTLAGRMTAQQMALLIKIQARIRGLLTRKKVRATYAFGNRLNSANYGQLDP